MDKETISRLVSKASSSFVKLGTVENFFYVYYYFVNRAQNIVTRYPSYNVTFHGIGEGPVGTEVLGTCTQMAVFHRLSPIEECSEIIGVDELFKLVAKSVYPIFVDNRSDNEKLLHEAIRYIMSFYYNQYEERYEGIILKDVLSYLHEKKFTVTIETLIKVLRDANWVIKDGEDGPIVMINCLPDSEDEDEKFEIDNDSIYEENKMPESTDGDEHDLHENSYTENWNEQLSIIIPENRSIIQENTYLFDGENVEYELSEKPYKIDDDVIRVSKITNTESLICTIQELSSAPTSLPFNEMEVDSKVERLNADTPSGFNTSLAKSNSSLALNNSSVDNTVIESALLQRDINLAAVEEQVQKTTNFQPYMSVSLSSTAPPLFFSSELNNSLDNCSASFQNESCDKFHHISLNDTFRQSEITNESAINVEESTTENILSLPLKQNFLEEDCIQNSEINSAISFPNCAIIKNKGIFQVYENNDTADMVPLNDFNSSPNKQPKFTSSPKVSTKTSINNIEQSDSKLKKSSIMNRNLLLNIIESTKENVSDTDSNLSKDISQKSNDTFNSEIFQLCADSLSDNVINNSKCNVDLHLVSNNTQLLLCLENEEFNKIVESTRDLEVEKSDVINRESDITDDVQNVEAHHSSSSENEEFSKIVESTRDPEKFVEQSDVINRESDNTDDVQNVDAHHNSLLHNENINDKEDMCCTLTKTDDNDMTMKAHQEDVINDFAQSNVRSLSPPKELSSFKLQNDSECSSTERAKKTSILETDRLIANSSSSNKDTTNVQFASVLKKGDEIVGTSKDVNTSNIIGSVNVEAKLASPFETPPNSWSPEIMDSGYPNSASVQDITPEYDLSSIAQDHIPDSESPSIAEAPRLGILEPIEVENGDLANNNRDGEGNNMMAVDADNIENLQPLIDVLENDLENENDIYVVQNGFPIWLLRLLDMANPLDFDMQDQQHMRDLADEAAGNCVSLYLFALFV